MTHLSAAPPADELDDRAGYDPAFLGPPVPVPLPTEPLPTVLLRYLHYSVLFRPDRRFAAVTALALDGARLFQVDRTDAWRLDPRLAAELQAGPPVYADNDLDRGHLVMRASATWGHTEEEARKAEADTFYFPNAAPQNKLFNQGRKLWAGLEHHVLDHAAAHDRKLVVLTGPVLDPADPPYRGIRIPLRFWKVVAFVQAGALAATGYLLDQTPLVDDLTAAFEDVPAGQVPPLGAFRTFQVPVADLAALTGLELGRLALADLLGAAATGTAPPPGGANTGWLRLSSLDGVVLTS
ncbi:DNA/RNA non-specific endonuclease [Blastococcus haudaquaticus]|uniref:Endonuclease G n=1 Tax=Blastococcus haudaquaticus TaxID=1938745 RepID=A0A286GI52_9ACTN|nr:DNA/RNA non-specific endonuclease [Blastococcus haudaquaticus]SOD95213.1 endonuclease G [Blastococcus haudaquaticus]